ncbi:hypothetical protein LCGC14_3008670, partial [marine sediment metagenome]
FLALRAATPINKFISKSYILRLQARPWAIRQSVRTLASILRIIV